MLVLGVFVLASAVGYEAMHRLQLQGFRNGCWRRLSGVERAFFRASMWYMRVRGKIVSARVVGLLYGILERLKSSVGLRLYGAGELRVRELSSAFVGNAVFSWCPRLEAWLREDRYILYLGVLWMNSSDAFRSPR